MCIRDRYHHRGETVDPDATGWRVLDPEDERIMREGVARFMPEANGPLLSWRACMFTNTPDEHFVLDTLPGAPQVVVASPCSGHGYKFASVMGEVLADFATGSPSGFDLSLFRLDRLAA